MKTYTVKIERTTVETAEIELVYDDDVDVDELDIGQACYDAEDPMITLALAGADWELSDVMYDTDIVEEKK